MRRPVEKQIPPLRCGMTKKLRFGMAKQKRHLYKEFLG